MPCGAMPLNMSLLQGCTIGKTQQLPSTNVVLLAWPGPQHCSQRSSAPSHTTSRTTKPPSTPTPTPVLFILFSYISPFSYKPQDLNTPNLSCTKSTAAA